MDFEKLYFPLWPDYNGLMAEAIGSEKADAIPSEANEPIRTAAANGVDVGQLRDNLALTVSERLRRHQLALDVVETLQRAKRP